METTTRGKEQEVRKLRSEIRNRKYNHYNDRVLKIPLVDLYSIEYRIEKLKELGEDVSEYCTFVRDLLLEQVDKLHRMIPAESGYRKRMLKEHAEKTMDILWPKYKN